MPVYWATSKNASRSSGLQIKYIKKYLTLISWTHQPNLLCHLDTAGNDAVAWVGDGVAEVVFGADFDDEGDDEDGAGVAGDGVHDAAGAEGGAFHVADDNADAALA